MSRTCIEFLKCFFTPAERAEFSEEMARQMAAQFEAEEEFKQVKQQFKDRITGHAQAAKKLARRLNFGYEFRSVECAILLDNPAFGKKTIVRTDTGEEVSVRDVEDSDRRTDTSATPITHDIALENATPQNLPGMDDGKSSSAGAND
jgi:hypothetical protein